MNRIGGWLDELHRRKSDSIRILLTVLPSGPLRITGMISSLKRPFFWAASAFSYEARAKASWVLRSILYCLATFSEVMPMGSMQSMTTSLAEGLTCWIENDRGVSAVPTVWVSLF